MEPYEVSDEILLLRAVRNARATATNGAPHPRWVAVMDVFAVGSSYAHMICRRFGYDPDELVKP